MNGVGKTTFIRKLELRLISGGMDVEVFKAPNYNTVSGQVIKRFLEGKYIDDDIEEVFSRNRMEV